MASTIAKCQFCGRDGPHPAAHILPNSLYRSGSGNRLTVLNASGAVPAKWLQTGIYDRKLWCQSCERNSSQLDTYAAQLLLNVDKLAEPYRDTGGRSLALPDGTVLLWTLSHVNPLRLQVFVLSVLWRASASQRREVNGFTLGLHQDRIREVLQSRDVATLKKYPYLLRYERDEELRGGFLCPIRTRHQGVEFASFHGGGFGFDLKIDEQELPDLLSPLANGPDRQVLMMSYSILETDVGRQMARAVRHANNDENGS